MRNINETIKELWNEGIIQIIILLFSIFIIVATPIFIFEISTEIYKEKQKTKRVKLVCNTIREFRLIK